MPPITIAELLTDLSTLKASEPADALSLVTIDPSLLPASLKPAEGDDQNDTLAAARELIDLHVEISQRKGLEELAGGRGQVEEIVRKVQEKV
ncbi:hypothetical protein TWF173_009802 [Orbilia oligospora]|uniref:Uncharacterized protein n=2 Tax=Orbilia oligospora TaxID=2813651 RepID=G1X1K5_ARTOA|nr:hypothetical protein AOL_s00007g164 [Orbilia oligospora ATCC 24927]KAF3195316.1 hypothetical protein TWF225_003718 [Orbilia oligospora]EGX52828.1 hypothetical protein AOL_s00007g164 [Orbilia oligospora ATCC 24927]KAF3267632.1 hypothetical protein TWF128_009152 [Orbilia oligospora]KAF3269162.1 hypothetical protein TWF217_009259 [Orbilia oligospora]KAF3287633.1 hypothetical protein TWF970_007343 [Orbilia oligospora]